MGVTCPSNLLNHLLEMSLCRAATEIIIEVENGGITELCVKDNGTGIPNISQYIQHSILQEIHPYCQLKMTSKIASVNKGCFYHSIFGHLHKYEDVDCTTGTSICIIDLFFNMPDKYRRLRKDSDERQQIINIACEFYILHGLSIKLVSSNEVIFHLPRVLSLEERISFLPSSYFGKRVAVILHTCGTVHILQLKGVALHPILEKEYGLPEYGNNQLTQLLNFDKTLFAIVNLKRNADEEEIAQMMFEIEQRLAQWKLNKDRNKTLSASLDHKSIERETLLRAKVIKGICHYDSPAVTMDKNELTITLPNGFTVIIPVKQLGY